MEALYIGLGLFVGVIGVFFIVTRYMEGVWRGDSWNPFTHKNGWVISFVYVLPVIGGYFIGDMWVQGEIGKAWMSIFLVVIMGSVWISDIKDKLILDLFTYPAMVIFLFGSIFVYGEYIWWVHVIGGGLVWGMVLLAEVVVRKKMGRGDIKLFIPLGFLFGMIDIVYVVMISSILGLGMGIYLMVRGRNGEVFAFGPYIVIAVMIMWFGEGIGLM